MSFRCEETFTEKNNVFRPRCVLFSVPPLPTLKMWANNYYVDLLEYDWVQKESPAGTIQWTPILKADVTDSDIPDIMMLTSDIALPRLRIFPSALVHLAEYS